jgi:hypothetical protein
MRTWNAAAAAIIFLLWHAKSSFLLAGPKYQSFNVTRCLACKFTFVSVEISTLLTTD